MSLDVYLEKMVLSDVYTDNITHNLGRMAQEAGLYDVLWRPEENDIYCAAEMIPHLEAGLARLRANPELYEQFNPPNGWGNYVGLVCFVNQLLQACKKDPDARVRACR
jgi:hypothetical protein